MQDLKTFGQRLKWARERTNPRLTQEELGRLMRKDTLTISKWERNQHPPRARGDYDELAFHLGCGVVWLREGTGEPGTRYVPDPEAPDQERRRAIRRTPHMRSLQAPYPGGGQPSEAREATPSHAPVDWEVVAQCALLLTQNGHPTATALARALSALYAIAQRAPGAIDLGLAEEILASMT